MPTPDQLFLLNLGLDALLLWSLQRLCTGRGTWHVAPAAILGAALATLAVLPGAAWAGSLGCEALCAVTMVGITCSPRSLLMLVRDTLLLLGLAAVLAGLSLIAQDLLPGTGGLWPVGLGATVFLILQRPAQAWLRRSRQRSGVRDVEVEIAGRTTRLRCLLDSGCMAHDPMTGLPVMVAELASLRPMLPARLQSALRHPGLIAAQEAAGAAEEGEIYGKIRLVEVQTVGRGSEWLMGFRGTIRAEGAPSSAVVLVTPRRLSRRGSFEAIAPLEFWNCEEGNAS